MRVQGTYTWIRKYPMWRWSRKLTPNVEYSPAINQTHCIVSLQLLALGYSDRVRLSDKRVCLYVCAKPKRLLLPNH